MEIAKDKKSQSRQKRSAADLEKRKSSFAKDLSNLDLEIHGVRLPKFDVQPEYLELIENPEKVKNTYDFLIALCQKGFKKLNIKRGTAEHKKYTDRIYYELEILKELNPTKVEHKYLDREK